MKNFFPFLKFHESPGSGSLPAGKAEACHIRRMCRSGGRKILSALLSAVMAANICMPMHALAYDEYKVEKKGLVRGDLATWTQHEDSFPQNKELSINGSSPLSSMGCSYYATFFMLCKMGLKDPLKDTAWQFAKECKDKGLSREGTGYFDPRSISKLTGGRAKFVEAGNGDNYYDGQAAVHDCGTEKDVLKLLKKLMYQKDYFLVACVVGNVTNCEDLPYYSEGHYIFIDSIKGDDFVIGDSAFPGTRWSENWGAHDASIVKVYAYKLFDGKGRQVSPSECQSIYVERMKDED